MIGESLSANATLSDLLIPLFGGLLALPIPDIVFKCGKLFGLVCRVPVLRKAQILGLVCDLSPFGVDWHVGLLELVGQEFDFLGGLLALERAVFFAEPVNEVLKDFVAVAIVACLESVIAKNLLLELEVLTQIVQLIPVFLEHLQEVLPGFLPVLAAFLALANPQLVLVLDERLFALLHRAEDVIAGEWVVLDHSVHVLPLPVRCHALLR